MENENLKQLLKDAEDWAEEHCLLDLNVAEKCVEKPLKAAEDHLKGLEECAEWHLQSTLGIIMA